MNITPTQAYSPRAHAQPPVPETLPTAVYEDFIASMPSLVGKVAVVTGANTGLGFWAARSLALKGAHVYLACRDLEKAEAARKEMVDDLVKHGQRFAVVKVVHLDLTSFASVRACAEGLRAAERSVSLLLNNAGVMAVQPVQTTDGYDVQLQVNHLGHFLLTHELLPLLLAADGGARVVQHSSLAHIPGYFDETRPNEGGARWLMPLPAEWRR